MLTQHNIVAQSNRPSNADGAAIDAIIDKHCLPASGNGRIGPQVAFDVLRDLGNAGWLALAPGDAPSFGRKVLLAERLAYRSAGLAATVLAHLNIPLWLLKHHGSSEVCRAAYRASLEGTQIGSTAISEFAGGSDPVGNIDTRVTMDGDTIVLDGGGKSYVLNAPGADYALVMARSQERSDVLGLTWVLVPLDSAGVVVERQLLGALDGASMGAVSFTQCRLSRAHLVGEPHRAFLQLMPAFIEERLSGSVVALCVAKRALDECVEFVRSRTFEERTLADNAVVRHQIAELHGDYWVAKKYLDSVNDKLVRALPVTQEEAAGVKLIAAQAAKRIVTGCAQLHGGRGFLRSYGVASWTLDVLAAQFFAGVPEVMKEIVARAKPLDRLSDSAAPEHEFRLAIRAAVERHVVPHLDEFEQNGVSHTLFKAMGQENVFKTLVAAAHGGDGRDFMHSIAIAEELMRHRATGVGSSLMLQANTLCPILSRCGNDHIRTTFLRPLMEGDAIGSLAVTEPTGGSAIMTAVHCHAEADGDNWVINGEKMFITNGPIADFIVVLARTETHAGPFSMSLIVVPSTTPGFEVVEKLDKLGLNASPVGRLKFTNCRVPKANLIGTRGKGYLQVSDIMKEERLIIAIGAIALATSCLEQTRAYLKTRMSGGRPLSEHPAVRQELGQFRAELDAGCAFGYLTAQQLIKGEDVMVATSIAKFRLCELAQRVIQRCVEFHGTAGLIEGAWIERAFRDSRVLSVYAGSSETMRELVGRRLFPTALRKVA